MLQCWERIWDRWQIASERTRRRECPPFPVNRWKEKIGGMVREKKDVTRSPSQPQCSDYRNANCTTSSCLEFGKSVLWGTSRLMTSQARSRNQNWLKFSVNVEYAWQSGKIFQDDEPPKSSWSLRKSTKSWDQFKRAKIHKSHTKSRRRSIACEKIVLPILVAWVVRTDIRGQNSGREGGDRSDAPAEKRR